jgi:hypothetical protein
VQRLQIATVVGARGAHDALGEEWEQTPGDRVPIKVGEAEEGLEAFDPRGALQVCEAEAVCGLGEPDRLSPPIPRVLPRDGEASGRASGALIVVARFESPVLHRLRGLPVSGSRRVGSRHDGRVLTCPTAHDRTCSGNAFIPMA